VIRLPTLWTIVIDCLAWAIFQTAIAYVFVKLPRSRFSSEQWLFRTRRWERGGATYQKIFRVRRWKSLLPSGGTLLGGFPMQRIASWDSDYLKTWIAETCRAELCHWFSIMPAPFFFLWNPVSVGIGMVVYALLFNLPLVITQRYNRSRLVAIVGKLEGRRGRLKAV